VSTTAAALQPNVIVTGPMLPEPVQVIVTVPLGASVKLIGKGLRTGQVHEPILSLEQIATLQVSHPAGQEPFDGDAARFRLGVEAMRLGLAYEYDPYFTLSIARVDPLPHQLEAVYDYLLKSPRIRFMLADDPGAGKTIMAGLLIKELKIRGLARRILIVTPANLSFQWQRELQDKFHERFEVVRGEVLRANYGSNPWQEKNQVITSVSWVSRIEDAKESLLRSHWDLVVVDEAHKMSAYSAEHKTLAYQLGEALGELTDHYLLMTATPHKGDPENFALFLALLDRDVYGDVKSLEEAMRRAEAPFYLRRVKEALVGFPDPETGEVKALFTKRFVRTAEFQIDADEWDFYMALTRYVEEQSVKAAADDSARGRALGFTMAMLQRRFASSVYAVRRSLERMREKRRRILQNPAGYRQEQIARRLPADFDELPDEERQDILDDLEEIVASVDPAALRAEIADLDRLIVQACAVEASESESKLTKLREILTDQGVFSDPTMKLLVFTEHKDTLDYLVSKLRDWGLLVTQIHGGMKIGDRDTRDTRLYAEREFKESCQVLVATEAAGEGINLQFCWLMVNYDIPWNPARLEQRMGRIHRYLQAHDPVIIANLVAGKTREGRVLRALLQKLERMRKELGSDKVFDVIGYLFEGQSLTDYMEQALTDDDVANRLAGKLTDEQVIAHQERDRKIYGEGGDVRSELPRLRAAMERESYRHLLPGYVRRFVGAAAPALGIAVEGSLDGVFAFGNIEPGALDPLLPVLERYPERRRSRLTCSRPSVPDDAVWLHPGEPVFERLRAMVTARFDDDALRGAVLVDPTAQRPYMLHFALMSVVRDADPRLRDFREAEVLEFRLVAIAQDDAGAVWQAPAEGLMLLRPGDGVPTACYRFADAVDRLREEARGYALGSVAGPLAEARRQELLASLQERLDFVSKGYDFQEAELAERRSKLRLKARAGNARAIADLNAIRERQRVLEVHRYQALAMLEREPELIGPGEVQFIAHALVVPSSDPEDLRRRDQEVEAIAMQVVRAWEEAVGATVLDVSTPAGAQAAGLIEWPGFDLLSRRPDGEERAIEVKGRAGVGDVELSENEWIRADNLRQKYWLYVVYNCASDAPRLERVHDPFGKGIGRAKGGVVIAPQEVTGTGSTGYSG